MDEYTPANIIQGQVGYAEAESVVKIYVKVLEGTHIYGPPSKMRRLARRLKILDL